MANYEEYEYFDESLGEWDGDEYNGWTFYYYDSNRVILQEDLPDVSDTIINNNNNMINNTIINKTDANND